MNDQKMRGINIHELCKASNGSARGIHVGIAGCDNNARTGDPSGEHSEPNIRAVGSRAVRTELHSRIVGKKIDEHMADIVTGIGVLRARVTQADNHPGIR